MYNNILKCIIITSLALGVSTSNFDSAEAAAIVMWGKTELKLGQIGKVTISANTPLVKLNSDGSLINVRTLKKDEEFRVYSYKSIHGGLYGVGGGCFVKKGNSANYETPSKSKLALLKEISDNPEPTQKPIHSNVEDGLAVISGAPTGYMNCTALKEYYPNGVKKGHPAYASKHDGDKYGWACEPIGK